MSRSSVVAVTVRQTVRTHLLVLAALAAGCVAPWIDRSGGSTHGQPLGEGGRTEAPDAASLPDGRLVVVWGSGRADGSADVALSVLENGAWRRPVRVNPHAGSAVAGRQVGPRVAVSANGELCVAWVDRRRDAAGDIVASFSSDGGRKFLAPVRINDDEGLSGQEYHDVVALADGSFLFCWLDERDAPEDSVNQKQVYVATWEPPSRRIGANVRITESPSGVCPCCRPDIVADREGGAHVAYRDRVGGELAVRIRSRVKGDPAFGPPRDVSAPGWDFSGCPVDGPAVIPDGEGGLVVAWMDGVSGEETVWFAQSRSGESFYTARAIASLATRVPAGEEAGSNAPRTGLFTGRPVLARDDQIGVVGAWEDERGRLWLRQVVAAGPAPVMKEPLLLGSPGVAATARAVTLVPGPDALWAFWIEESFTSFTRVDFDLSAAGADTVSRLVAARIVSSSERIEVLPAATPGAGDR